MKFKKVEISAFRIYDNPKDSIFDFTTQNGEIANFVSLWAPNGFGKTSFYDAVEWGITNNVQRFWQGRNTEDSIDALQDIYSKQVSLLKNRNSSFETSVTVTYDTLVEKTRSLKVHGKRKADINKDDGENKEFSRVILSQEWISAFLKEVDGELRYRKFMENPELSDMDTYYTGVKHLVREAYDCLSKIRGKIGQYQDEIAKIENENLLESLNSAITSLALLGEDLQPLPNTTSDKEAIDFQNSVSSKIISYNRDIVISQLFDSIGLAKTGDASIVGLNYYYESISAKEKAESDIAINNNLLDKFIRRNEVEEEIKNQSLKRDTVNKLKKITEELIELFEGYSEVSLSINSLLEDKKMVDLSLNNSKSNLSPLQQKQSELKVLCDALAVQIADAEQEFTQLADIYSQKAKAEDELKELATRLFTQLEIVTEKDSKVKASAETISSLRVFLSAINSSPFSISPAEIPTNLLESFQILRVKEDSRSKILGEIESLNSKILQQESLNTTIEAFVGMGLEIVNNNQSSSCPLCSHTYESYIDLANNIANNKSLSQLIQELLAQRNSKNAELQSASSDVSEQLKQIVISLEADILEKSEAHTQLTSDYRTYANELDETKSVYNLLLEKTKEYTARANGLTFEDHKKLVEEKISKLKSHLSRQSELHLNTTSEIATLNNQINTLQKRSELLINEISEKRSEQSFRIVTDWFDNNYPNQPISLTLLQQLKAVQTEEAAEIITILNDAENELKNLNEDLLSYSKENILAKVEELSSKKENNDRIINLYQNFLSIKLQISDFPIPKEALLKLLDEKDTLAKAEFQKAKLIREKYLELEKWTANLVPFLQSERIKVKISEAENEAEFIENVVLKRLLDEKTATREYLNEQIQGYFYTDLINEIYNKIDPHPDFKSVEFRPNFDYDNPRLDILVVNSNDEEKLIPNLYFSTAQTNILSLSIFLATALTSPDYDSIFIDDPIQSMDSVNILSTIDLLRSIALNKNKQIILSTHDQNFHNLLKKKIPSKIFNSKFLELESFGKVKQSD